VESTQLGAPESAARDAVGETPSERLIAEIRSGESLRFATSD